LWQCRAQPPALATRLDQRVEALGHAHQQRVGGHRLDGQAVGVGHAQLVALDEDGVDGVGGGVDEAQTHALPAAHVELEGRLGRAAVDQVQRVVDIVRVQPPGQRPGWP
jgi:hypothetical protein